MTAIQIIAWIALGTVGIAIVLVVVPKIVFSLLRRPLEARIAANYQPGEILLKDLRANCFGLESAGVWQLRGNGGLVLTAECLHFFMFVPKREFRVPLDAITELTFTKSHLGKATIYNLLKVRFTSDGKSDSIAWYLTNPTAWKNKIEELKSARAAREGR